MPIKKTLPFLAIIAFVYIGLFYPGLKAAMDFPYHYGSMIDSLRTFQAWSWIGSNGLGYYTAATLWSGVLSLIISILTHLQISYNPATIIVYLVPSIILVNLGFNRLGKLLRLSDLSVLLAKVVYVSNSYLILLLDGGQMSMVLAYAMIPLAFYLFRRCEKAGTGVVLNLSLAYIGICLSDIRGLALLLILELLWFVYYVFTVKKMVSAGRMAVRTLSALIITVSFNSYWIFPFLASPDTTSLPASYFQSSQLAFLDFTQLKNAVFLLHPNWPLNVFGLVPAFDRLYIGLGILILSSTIILLRMRKHFFWLLLAALAIFLCKGSNPPFGNLYTTLFERLPGFFIFRDSTKFFTLIAFSYSMIIALAFDTLTSKIGSRRTAFVLIIVIIGYLLILAKPAWTGKLTGYLGQQPFAGQYTDSAELIKADSSFSRILWLGNIPPLGYSSSIHPGIDLFTALAVRPFALSAVGSYEKTNFVRDSRFVGDILGFASIGYVVYPYPDSRRTNLSEDDRNYYQTFWKQITESNWADKVVQNPPVGIIKSKNPKDHLYLLPKSEIVVGSDLIYDDLYRQGVLSTTALIFPENDGNLSYYLEQSPQSGVILYDKSVVDLSADLLEGKYYFYPSSYLSNSPDNDGWWKRNTDDFLWYRNFIQAKYGIDNADFDIGGGWGFAEGEKVHTFPLPKLNGDSVLVVRTLASDRGGKLNISVSDRTVGEINTVNNDNRIVEKRITGSESVADKILKYYSSRFQWTEVGLLRKGDAELTISSKGDLNIINAWAIVPPDVWAENRAKAQTLVDSGRAVIWDNSIKEDNPEGIGAAKVSYLRLAPTHYKVTVTGLGTTMTLVFSESFDPRWSLSGQSPLPVFGFLNGFTVSRDGEYDLYFLPQNYVHIGTVVTLLATGIITLVAVKNILRKRSELVTR